MTNEPSRALLPTRSSIPFVPLQLVARIVNGGTPKAGEENWDGDFPFITPPDLNGLHGDLVETWERTLSKIGVDSGSMLAGDAVLLSCRAPIGHVGRVSEPVAFNQGCKALVPERAADTRYLAYCLVAARPALEAMGNGTTFTELSSTALSALRLPWPGPDSRDSIVAYLDRETADIDAMDTELDRLMVSLRLRRSAGSSTLFRQGFSMIKLKWLMGEEDVRGGSRADSLPLLSVSIHHGVQSREDSTSRQRPGENLGNYKVAQPGDIVLNRMRAFQGALGVCPYEGLVSPDYSVLRPLGDLDSRWAEYIMRSPEFVGSMVQSLRGIGSVDQANVRTPRINVRDLLEIPIPLPHIDQQHEVIERLDRETTEIESMMSDALRLKSLLAERRTNLVTQVVTGRKELV